MTILGLPIGDIVFIIVSFCSAGFSLLKALEWLNSKLNVFETKKSRLDTRLDCFDEKLDGITDRLKKNESDTEALKQATISRIKGKIVDRHKDYMARGSIDYRTLDYIQQQYRAYEELGGNSYVHDLMKDLEGLPLED